MSRRLSPALALVAALLAVGACVLPAFVLRASVWQPWMRGASAAALAGALLLAWRARRFPLTLAFGAVVALPVLIAPARTGEWIADASLALPRRDAAVDRFDLARFRDRFNAAAGHRRVLALFSPT